jgi:TonB-linked SusC/RagA family outer membrane protein
LSPALEGADTFANFDQNARNNTLGNPLSIFEYGEGNNKNVQEYTVFDVTIAPEWTLGKGFILNGLFNYTLHRTNEKYFRPMTGSPSFYIAGLGYSRNEVRSFFSKESSVYSDIHLNWSRRFDDHMFKAFAGVRYSNFAYDSSYQSCHNTGNDKLPNVSASYSFLDEDGQDNVWRNLAYYANLDYSYRGKYYLQGSVSAETSSRFGRDIESSLKVGGVCWGIFPSLQAGWLMSAEPWFNANAINFLKLNAGFDMSGNDNISNNAAFAYFSNVQYQGRAMGLSLTNIENQSIQWETTSRYNIGFESVLFNNRLKVSADLFHNVTDDLLTLKNLHYLTGLDSYWCNGGSLKNDGFDASVIGKIINTKNWKWELGASVAHYKNTVTSLPDEEFTTDIYNSTLLTKVGNSVGVFYGYETKGVFATAADIPVKDGKLLSTQDQSTGKTTAFGAGDVHFIDQDGNNIINDADRVEIGNPNPDFYGNIHSNLSYKNLTLNATLNYVYGNDIYNYKRCLLESGSNFYNQTIAVTNRWRTEGNETDIPKATYGDPLGNNRFSDRWIEDGSYLRLKNVTLSYNVPVNLSWLQGLNIWVAGNNLFTLTNYLGTDPEFSCSNNVLFQGIDVGLLSQSRSFHVGVKINL